MNTAGALGGLVSSLIFGYLVESTGSYDAVLLSMAGMLIVGSALWLRIDATETLSLKAVDAPVFAAHTDQA
jgi:nitrate/nitrite transporter NarK